MKVYSVQGIFSVISFGPSKNHQHNRASEIFRDWFCVGHLLSLTIMLKNGAGQTICQRAAFFQMKKKNLFVINRKKSALAVRKQNLCPINICPNGRMNKK